MIKSIYSVLKLKERKGLDKPIFIVAALALALMFVALYYGAVSGWLDGMVNNFTKGVENVSK